MVTIKQQPSIRTPTEVGAEPAVQAVRESLADLKPGTYSVPLLSLTGGQPLITAVLQKSSTGAVSVTLDSVPINHTSMTFDLTDGTGGKSWEQRNPGNYVSTGKGYKVSAQVTKGQLHVTLDWGSSSQVFETRYGELGWHPTTGFGGTCAGAISADKPLARQKFDFHVSGEPFHQCHMQSGTAILSLFGDQAILQTASKGAFRVDRNGGFGRGGYPRCLVPSTRTAR